MAYKTNGVVGFSMLVLAFAVFGPVPRCFAGEAVAVSTNASELAQAQIKTLEEDITQSNKDITLSLAKLNKLYLQEGLTNRLVEFSANIIAGKKDPGSVAAAASALSAFHSFNRDFDAAAKVFEGVLANGTGSEWKATRVMIAKSLAPLYATYLGKSKDALSVLEHESSLCTTNDVAMVADLLNLRAQIMQMNLADPTGAVTCCQAVIALGSAVPLAALDIARNRLIGAYLETGARDQAIALVQQCIQASNATTTIALYAKKLADCGASPAQCGQSADVLRAKILASKASVLVVETLQPTLVNLLIRQGKTEEALQEARVLYYLSSDKGFPLAIDTVAQAFKAADSGLGRANQFLKFQKCGMAGEDGKTGTADDGQDPLSDIPVLRDDTRIRTMMDNMVALPLDSVGYRRRAEMYLFVDQPVDAFQAFQKSLELCSMTTNELQSATDALTGLLIRRTKDVSLAEQLVAYIMFGSFGKDGRAHTSDDLKNPVPAILERLRYAQVDAKASPSTVSGGAVAAPASNEISVPSVTPGS